MSGSQESSQGARVEPAKAVVGTSTSSSSIRKLPSAQQLQALNGLAPDVRGDVMRMAMQDYEIENTRETLRYAAIRNGQIAAFLIVTTFMALATFLVVSGFEVAGTVLGGVNVLGLATAFLAVTRSGKSGDQ